MDENTCMVERSQDSSWDFTQRETCGKCGTMPYRNEAYAGASGAVSLPEKEENGGHG